MEGLDFSVITTFVSNGWYGVKAFFASSLGSNLVVAFFSSLAGAFGGAIAAQKVIEKSKRKDVLLKELRSTNAAIMVGFSICNTALALKRQHSLPLYEQFTTDRKKAKEILAKLEAGEAVEEPFNYVADLKTIMLPAMPIDTLKSLVFNEISAHGKALSATSFLEGAYEGLTMALKKRELVVTKFQNGEINDGEKLYFYFGIKMKSGNINQEYSDLVEVIHSYNNDIIFFSMAVCEDLAQYGEQVRKQNAWLAKHTSKVTAPDWFGPKESGLVPPDGDYSSWINSFRETASE